MDTINIGKRTVGIKQPAFIVAETGINHNGHVDLLKRIINDAMESGVDAVKFQIYKTDEFMYKSNSMYKMFKDCEIDLAGWRDIIDYCNRYKVLYFFTPQNVTDLMDLKILKADINAIKVGSDDLTNIDLIKEFARMDKPLILSTGMAYGYEIAEVINTIEPINKQIILLHCVSSYPTEPNEVNILKMVNLRNTFKTIVGYSDHTQGIESALLAVSLGAKVIEKHFTYNKNLQGHDQLFSADKFEMKEMVKSIRLIEDMFGSQTLKPTSREIEMLKIARRVKTKKGYFRA